MSDDENDESESEEPTLRVENGITKLEVVVGLSLGLQARNSMGLVDQCNKYGREVRIEKLDSYIPRHVVDGTSIMQVMMLAGAEGSRLVFYIAGDDEKATRFATKMYHALRCKESDDYWDMINKVG